MSFKREGDDPSQLKVLKKRRVAELLANYIPEDEALLLRDGRYACTVCFQRPVFDTLDMLTVHRSGKKHLASLQKFYGKKRSLQNEVQKRQHQTYLRAEENGAQGGQGEAGAGASTAADRTGLPQPSSSELADEERPVGEEASPAVRLPGCRLAAAETRELTREKKFARQGKGRTTRKPSGPSDPEKQRALEHYLKLKRQFGWIQDGSGKWVKDENVEFDSDEEDPPVLPPL